MARQKLKAEENGEEIKQKDYAQAVRIYRQDIKQAVSKVGEFSQELSTAYKAIKKQCGISSKAAKLAFQLDDMEDFKRDDFLRSFKGMLKELGINEPFDLVDMADGPAKASREKPRLVTISDGTETDLSAAAEEVDEFDAAAPEAVAAE